MKGYFTVEAALVIPIVMGIYLFLIHAFFFQYNRCLFEQDTGIVAMRAAAMEADSNEETMQAALQDIENLYHEKLIMFQQEEAYARVKHGKVKIERKGWMETPFEKEVWLVRTAYENTIINPVLFIRTYRKITKED